MVGAQPRCARTGGGGRSGAVGAQRRSRGAGARRGADGRGAATLRPYWRRGGAAAQRGEAALSGRRGAAPVQEAQPCCAWRVFPPRIHSFGGDFAFDHAAEQIALGDDPDHAIPFDDRDAADAMEKQELCNRNNWLVGSDGDDRAGHEIAQGKIGSAVIKIVFPHIVGMRGGDTIDVALGDDPGQATGAVQNRQATDTGFVH